MAKREVFSIIYIFLLSIYLLLILLFFIRLISPRQIDDFSPEIPCDQRLIDKADVLYVIPKYNNKSISENQAWCDYTLSLNKELALHGLYHTYEEFATDRDESYLQESIDIFTECFNQPPKRFKPPQIKISENNAKMISKKMKLDYKLNQIFHKVYHCNDSGKYKNYLIDIF